MGRDQRARLFSTEFNTTITFPLKLLIIRMIARIKALSSLGNREESVMVRPEPALERLLLPDREGKVGYRWVVRRAAFAWAVPQPHGAVIQGEGPVLAVLLFLTMVRRRRYHHFVRKRMSSGLVIRVRARHENEISWRIRGFQ